MNTVQRAVLGAVNAITTFKGPYAGRKKCLNRQVWEKDRQKRKAARKARRRNRR